MFERMRCSHAFQCSGREGAARTAARREASGARGLGVVALEGAGAPGQHERVAVAVVTDGLDRRRFVDDGRVIQQQ